MPDPTDLAVAAAAAIASWAAVWVSKEAIGRAEKDARRRTAFEILVALEERVWALSDTETGQGRKELLAAAESGAPIGQAGKLYQGVLNYFDLAAFALLRGLAERSLCDDYLARLRGSTEKLVAFIKEYRRAVGNEGLYRNLEQYLVELERSTK